MGLRTFHLSVGGNALATSLEWHTASFTLSAGIPPAPLTLPTISGLLWDSGEDPAIGSAVPVGVTPNLQNAEVVIVGRGHSITPLDLGSGSEARLYAGGMNDATAAAVNWLDAGGIRTLITNSFLPRLAPTIFGYRGNGANSLRANINGILGGATGAGTPTTAGGKVGDGVAGGTAFAGTIHRVLIYDANLSAGDRTDLYAYLHEHYNTATYTKQVLCAGDSLTAGYHQDDNFIINGWTGGDYTHSYPYELAQARPAWKVFNHGITAIEVATMLTNDTGGIDPYYDATNFAQNVVVFWGNTNDLLNGASLATIKTRCSDYCAARKAVGYTVVAIPMMDRSGFSAGQRTDKDTYNTWLAGLVGTEIDAIVTLPTQLAGNSPWSTYSTYWGADQTHLSRLGYQALAPAVETAVAAL